MNLNLFLNSYVMQSKFKIMLFVSLKNDTAIPRTTSPLTLRFWLGYSAHEENSNTVSAVLLLALSYYMLWVIVRMPH